MVIRDIDQALGNIKKADEYLTRSGHLYKDNYPVQYEAFCTALSVSWMLQQHLENLKENL